MMRLLVMGSSQAATLALAREGFRAAHPGIETTFYALPGASWGRSRIDEAGRLGPAGDDRFGQQKSLEWNGRACIDLTGHDHVAVCAPRFRLYYLVRLLLEVDILGLPRAGAAQAISEAMLADTLAAWIDEECRALQARLPVGIPATVLAVPYPLAATDQPGPAAEPGLARLRRHPAAPRIEALYEGAIATALAGRGLGWVAQPRATRAGPFATKDMHARPGGLDPARPDLKHLDAAYGAQALAALGRSLAGRAAPAPAGAATPALPTPALPTPAAAADPTPAAIPAND